MMTAPAMPALMTAPAMPALMTALAQVWGQDARGHLVPELMRADQLPITLHWEENSAGV